jgi:hypothetical protein
MLVDVRWIGEAGRACAIAILMSGFGLCATDAREPRQVRKEATVTSLSVCRRGPEVWRQKSRDERQETRDKLAITSQMLILNG